MHTITHNAGTTLLRAKPMELGLCLYYMQENKWSEKKKSLGGKSCYTDCKKSFHERKKLNIIVVQPRWFMTSRTWWSNHLF